jgi:hypothetical protein
MVLLASAHAAQSAQPQRNAEVMTPSALSCHSTWATKHILVSCSLLVVHISNYKVMLQIQQAWTNENSVHLYDALSLKIFP